MLQVKPNSILTITPWIVNRVYRYVKNNAAILKCSIILFIQRVFGYTEKTTYTNTRLLAGVMMEKIKWTAALSVGVAEIDEQHQRLYAIIDDLLKAQKEDLDTQSILSILAQMADYSEYHFRTEDNFMIENDYPLFLSHRKEHLAYMKKLGSLIIALEKKEESVLEDLLEFLCNWWQTHITVSDLKYARYIKEQRKDG